jgi:hypothetical protein
MKWAIGLIVCVLALGTAALMVECAVFGNAWLLHRDGNLDAEIAWLSGASSWMPARTGVRELLERRYLERVQRWLNVDRLERAIGAFRGAHECARVAGADMDPPLTTAGIEAYARASKRMEARGELSQAADWDDSVFVLAIRARAPQQRYAALAGFMNALDLRTRDGKPCEALARVQWAKHGLWGTLAGVADNVEEDLMVQCDQSRRARGGR